MNARAGDPILLLARLGTSQANKLAQIGFTFRNPDESEYQARSQVDIVEISDGDYARLYTFTEEWDGYVEWDVNGVVRAREDIQVEGGSVVLPTPTVGGDTTTLFNSILINHGSDVVYHREGSGTVCPCRTFEGFRDPSWHVVNLPGTPNVALAGPPWGGVNPPVCNEEGFQSVIVIEFAVKAAVQPASSGQRRLAAERASELLGDIERDDHLGIFPIEWNGNVLDFTRWSDAGEDFIQYDGRRFLVVAADKIPDVNGNPNHHYEVGLRLIKDERAAA